MRHIDLAIIGSGVGGALIGALHQDQNVIVFEKDSNLGGCASTFCKDENYYNTGATTLVGHEEYHPLKTIFDKANFTPDLKPSPIAIRTIQNNKILDRTANLDEFLQNLEATYPHPNNRLFWSKIYDIDTKFWKLKHLHYEKYSLKGYLKSVKFLMELLITFKSDTFKSASAFISKYLPNISIEYRAFIDAQLLITVQAKSHDISLLTMALGLAYPFHKVYYANGGMGKIIQGLLNNVEVHTKEAIKSITKHQNGYILHSRKGDYFANQVVLNTTVYESAKLFIDKPIQNYYKKFGFSDQSAFVLYLKIDSKAKFLHHYQIILEHTIPNCISNAFFVSFSDIEDQELSNGGYSVTISTHTKALMWKNLNKEAYQKQKAITQNFLMDSFLEHFDTIQKESIKEHFSATSTTFNRHIGRLNCGGKAISLKSMLSLPTPNTPFKGLYSVGDTIFAGQGWPGVGIGATVLNSILKEEMQ